MKNDSAKYVIEYLIGLILERLDDIQDIMDAPEDQFAYGEKTAYVEVAEILQYWKKSKKHGLDFRIEDKYPLL